MASSQHVEMEAAKFLHKLIQDSKDEPAKLATKLYVILQHMKLSGKEQSLPYQVISRAMETVISQHGLDIDVLKSSRLPLTGGTQIGDPGLVRSKDKDASDSSAPIGGLDMPVKGGSANASHAASSSKTKEDDRGSAIENEMAKHEAIISNRPPVGPSRLESTGHDGHQGPISQRSAKSFEHESPTSLGMEDSRSATSRERNDTAKLDKKVNQRENKKAGSKRKKTDSAQAVEVQPDNPQQFDTPGTGFNPKKGKMTTRGDVQGPSPGITNEAVTSLHELENNSSTNTAGIVGKVNEGSSGAFSSYPEARKTSSSPGAEAPASMPTGVVLANMHKMVQGGETLGPLSKENALGKNEMADHRDQDSVSQPKLEAPQKGTCIGSSGNMEMSTQRNTKPIDMGRIPGSQASASLSVPFKEHQLKQLRAQCLVFLAFRNNLVPRKLHLDIALGESYPKEDGAHKEVSLKEPVNSHGITALSVKPSVNSGTGKEMLLTRNLPFSSSTGSPVEMGASSKGTEVTKKTTKNKKGPASDQSFMIEERKCLQEADMRTQETADSLTVMARPLESDSLMNGGKNGPEHGHWQVGQANHAFSSVLRSSKQLEPHMTRLMGISTLNDASREMQTPTSVESGHLQEKIDNPFNQSQVLKHNDRVSIFHKADVPIFRTNAPVDKFPSASLVKEQTMSNMGKKDIEHDYFRHMVKPPVDINMYSRHVGHMEKLPTTSAPVISNSGPDDQRLADIRRQFTSDGFKAVAFPGTVIYGNSVTQLDKSAEQEEEDILLSSDVPGSSLKYTTTEKWIVDQQKRKLLEQKSWAVKQRKTDERIAARFDKLKENVSSCEDISIRTRSVIELKKLQLLRVQRRLRSDFLHDFFKPITPDMERLKSIKKHRHGRRMKQLERLEQKMKEERQKRIRERQKEFFSEIEAHKERLEDCFKVKRERWKGFNRYVKEFHKRKEKTQREKADRIQREKINLLKINDVEGYLRMVQDAKSDRVKQLLKETEKYLQKLGSKLQEAKVMARQFEMEMDDNRATNFLENSEIIADNEDDGDQAQHYLESNEKYYLMAHSVKESISEQPASLEGGKLREYQMNGLRWLVSLYNNHLNGILADEMGLGKTVQVISLMCYLMESKNDKGPFLVVVPSSVLAGWESEISFWAPSMIKIVYFGPPEERRRLYREKIVHQKFNVLLTTYEYLMNKNDRPRLSKIHWHYIIIDEGHRIKNASCKLNSDLKHYQSSHRLLLTGTPLQNNIEELWALLNFLLPNIFNSSEDFSQWFSKPFENGGDNSPDEALLSEEENLLIINRLHQVLRPFVLRRLKQKVANELPEKIERLVRCEASAYQKLLMKRVEDNLGFIGISKGRSIHNSVMELRNICNHPYLSQMHTEEVHSLIPKHYLPPIVRLCGKLEMLDRLLPKLKATDHRVLLFSTMTRLLDIMEEYLSWKGYKYLRLDGHTSGSERGALIEEFNRPDSPTFIFLLSIRAGGVGVNLQAADTVIIFDTDWNPQVDLQAQARAHRLGQKRDVLVLRLETINTVEEQVRAAAEYKLGVANQSITAGFFDNNTSAEDRREYLESLLRECKKEEAALVLNDDALNDLIARSESEIEIFESVDKQRREVEMAAWQGQQERSKDDPLLIPPRLITDEDLNAFYKALEAYEASQVMVKRKTAELDSQLYGRGKRAREVRSYEDQWTEEEFEKLCQVDSPEHPEPKEIPEEAANIPSASNDAGGSKLENIKLENAEAPLQSSKEPLPSKELMPSKEPLLPCIEAPPPSKEPPLPSKEMPAPPSKEPLPLPSKEPLPLPSKEAAASEQLPPSKGPPLPSKEPSSTYNESPPPARRGRGRPKRATTDGSSSPRILPMPSETVSQLEMGPQREILPGSVTDFSLQMKGGNTQHELNVGTTPGSLTSPGHAIPSQVKAQGRKTQSGSAKPRGRAKKQIPVSPTIAPEVSPISRLPKEISLETDASLGSASAQDRKRLLSGTSNAPAVSFEVSPISGLQKPADVVSLAQEKHTSLALAPIKRETEMAFPVSVVKAAATFVTKPEPSTDHISLMASKEHDSVKTSAMQAGLEQNLSQSLTVVPEKHKSTLPVLEKKEKARASPVSNVKAAAFGTKSTPSAVHTSLVESKKHDNAKTSLAPARQEQKVSSQSSTASQEKHKSILPTLDRRKNERVSPVSEVKTAAFETKSASIVESTSSVESKKHVRAKNAVARAGKEQTVGRSATVAQEKEKTTFSVPGKKESERIDQASEGRASAFETKPALSTDHASLVESKKHDSPKVSVMQTGPEQKVNSQSPTVASTLAHDLMERQDLQMVSSEMTSDQKWKVTEKSESSVPSSQKAATSGPSKAVPPSSFRDTMAHKELHMAKTVEVVDNVHPNSALDMSSQAVKNEALSVAAPVHQKQPPMEKNKRKLSARAKPGTEGKASLSTTVHATVEAKNACISESAPLTGLAYLLGSKEPNSNDNTTKVITMGDGQGNGTKQPVTGKLGGTSLEIQPSVTVSMLKPNPTPNLEHPVQIARKSDVSTMGKKAPSLGVKSSSHMEANEVKCDEHAKLGSKVQVIKAQDTYSNDATKDKDDAAAVGLSQTSIGVSSMGQPQVDGRDVVSLTKAPSLESQPSETTNAETLSNKSFGGNKDGAVHAASGKSKTFSEGVRQSPRRRTRASSTTVSSNTYPPIEKRVTRSAGRSTRTLSKVNESQEDRSTASKEPNTESKEASLVRSVGIVNPATVVPVPLTFPTVVKEQLMVSEANPNPICSAAENSGESRQMSQENLLMEGCREVTCCDPIVPQDCDASHGEPVSSKGSEALTANDCCTGAAKSSTDSRQENCKVEGVSNKDSKVGSREKEASTGNEDSSSSLPPRKEDERIDGTSKSDLMGSADSDVPLEIPRARVETKTAGNADSSLSPCLRGEDENVDGPSGHDSRVFINSGIPVATPQVGVEEKELSSGEEKSSLSPLKLDGENVDGTSKKDSMTSTGPDDPMDICSVGAEKKESVAVNADLSFSPDLTEEDEKFDGPSGKDSTVVINSDDLVDVPQVGTEERKASTGDLNPSSSSSLRVEVEKVDYPAEKGSMEIVNSDVPIGTMQVVTEEKEALAQVGTEEKEALAADADPSLFPSLKAEEKKVECPSVNDSAVMINFDDPMGTPQPRVGPEVKEASAGIADSSVSRTSRAEGQKVGCPSCKDSTGIVNSDDPTDRQGVGAEEEKEALAGNAYSSPSPSLKAEGEKVDCPSEKDQVGIAQFGTGQKGASTGNANQSSSSTIRADGFKDDDSSVKDSGDSIDIPRTGAEEKESLKGNADLLMSSALGEEDVTVDGPYEKESMVNTKSGDLMDVPEFNSDEKEPSTENAVSFLSPSTEEVAKLDDSPRKDSKVGSQEKGASKGNADSSLAPCLRAEGVDIDDTSSKDSVENMGSEDPMDIHWFGAEEKETLKGIADRSVSPSQEEDEKVNGDTFEKDSKVGSAENEASKGNVDLSLAPCFKAEDVDIHGTPKKDSVANAGSEDPMDIFRAEENKASTGTAGPNFSPSQDEDEKVSGETSKVGSEEKEASKGIADLSLIPCLKADVDVDGTSKKDSVENTGSEDPMDMQLFGVEDKEASMGTAEPSSSPLQGEDEEVNGVISENDSKVITNPDDLMGIPQGGVKEKEAPERILDSSSTPSLRVEDERAKNASKKDSEVCTASDDPMDIPFIRDEAKETLAGNSNPSSSHARVENCKGEGVSDKDSKVGSREKEVSTGNEDLSSSLPPRKEDERIDGTSKSDLIGSTNSEVPLEIPHARVETKAAGNADSFLSPCLRVEDEKVHAPYGHDSKVFISSGIPVATPQVRVEEKEASSGDEKSSSSPLKSEGENVDGISKKDSMTSTVSDDPMDICSVGAEKKESFAGNANLSFSPDLIEEDEKCDDPSGKDSTVVINSDDLVDIPQAGTEESKASTGDLDPSSSSSLRVEDEKADCPAENDSMEMVNSDVPIGTPQVGTEDKEASSGNVDSFSSPTPRVEDEKIGDPSGRDSTVIINSDDPMDTPQVGLEDKEASAADADPSLFLSLKVVEKKVDCLYVNDSAVIINFDDPMDTPQPRVGLEVKEASAGIADSSLSPTSRAEGEMVGSPSCNYSTVIVSSDDPADRQGFGAEAKEVLAGNAYSSPSPSLKAEGEKVDGSSEKDQVHIPQFGTGRKEASTGNANQSSSSTVRADGFEDNGPSVKDSGDSIVIPRTGAEEKESLKGNANLLSSSASRAEDEKVDGPSEKKSTGGIKSDDLMDVPAFVSDEKEPSTENAVSSSSPSTEEVAMVDDSPPMDSKVGSQEMVASKGNAGSFLAPCLKAGVVDIDGTSNKESEETMGSKDPMDIHWSGAEEKETLKGIADPSFSTSQEEDEKVNGDTFEKDSKVGSKEKEASKGNVDLSLAPCFKAEDMDIHGTPKKDSVANTSSEDPMDIFGAEEKEASTETAGNNFSPSQDEDENVNGDTSKVGSEEKEASKGIAGLSLAPCLKAEDVDVDGTSNKDSVANTGTEEPMDIQLFTAEDKEELMGIGEPSSSPLQEEDEDVNGGISETNSKVISNPDDLMGIPRGGVEKKEAPEGILDSSSTPYLRVEDERANNASKKDSEVCTMDIPLVGDETKERLAGNSNPSSSHAKEEDCKVGGISDEDSKVGSREKEVSTGNADSSSSLPPRMEDEKIDGTPRSDLMGSTDSDVPLEIPCARVETKAAGNADSSLSSCLRGVDEKVDGPSGHDSKVFINSGIPVATPQVGVEEKELSSGDEKSSSSPLKSDGENVDGTSKEDSMTSTGPDDPMDICSVGAEKKESFAVNADLSFSPDLTAEDQKFDGPSGKDSTVVINSDDLVDVPQVGTEERKASKGDLNPSSSSSLRVEVEKVDCSMEIVNSDVPIGTLHVGTEEKEATTGNAVSISSPTPGGVEDEKIGDPSGSDFTAIIDSDIPMDIPQVGTEEKEALVADADPSLFPSLKVEDKNVDCTSVNDSAVIINFDDPMDTPQVGTEEKEALATDVDPSLFLSLKVEEKVDCPSVYDSSVIINFDDPMGSPQPRVGPEVNEASAGISDSSVSPTSRAEGEKVGSPSCKDSTVIVNSDPTDRQEVGAEEEKESLAGNAYSSPSPSLKVEGENVDGPSDKDQVDIPQFGTGRKEASTGNVNQSSSSTIRADGFEDNGPSVKDSGDSIDIPHTGAEEKESSKGNADLLSSSASRQEDEKVDGPSEKESTVSTKGNDLMDVPAFGSDEKEPSTENAILSSPSTEEVAKVDDLPLTGSMVMTDADLMTISQVHSEDKAPLVGNAASSSPSREEDAKVNGASEKDSTDGKNPADLMDISQAAAFENEAAASSVDPQSSLREDEKVDGASRKVPLVINSNNPSDISGAAAQGKETSAYHAVPTSSPSREDAEKDGKDGN
ncbi:chromatin structure-remodeling complex protein SYD-like isoform X2 [Magnolia sinica]|uniref:chromatin structure-remodeling complex protein SYD-like isoform X2 n=1 Tax=Magnolia sinica TaxID=86752 RepID=UPI00265AF0F6|nr:chromatin structure-remodeling complex protein SYD-like isoform X2 [Magnolia sinica]